MFTVSIITSSTEDAQKIKGYIDKKEYSTEIYSSAKDLLAEIEENKFHPDIVFIETIVNKCSGVSIAARIKESFPPAQIVFVSLKKCSKLDVYDVEHVYTIYSEINEEKVKKALQHACLKLDLSEKKVFWYMKNGAKHSVRQEDILYFEKDKRKVRVYFCDGSLDEFYENMENLLAELSRDFLRCHNSYVVNMKRIKCMTGNNIVMEDKMEVPISRTYSKEVKKYMTY